MKCKSHKILFYLQQNIEDMSKVKSEKMYDFILNLIEAKCLKKVGTGLC